MKTSGSGGKEPNIAQRYVLDSGKQLFSNYRWAGDLEDLRQSVLLKLNDYDDDYWNTHVENLHAYVHTIIRNLAIDTFRHNGNEEPTDESELSPLLETWLSQKKPFLRDPTKTYIDTLIGQKLLNECTDEDRTLLELLYEGYKENEIAAALGVPYGALRKRVQRLFRKLRLLMDSGDKDPP